MTLQLCRLSCIFRRSAESVSGVQYRVSGLYYFRIILATMATGNAGFASSLLLIDSLICDLTCVLLLEIAPMNSSDLDIRMIAYLIIIRSMNESDWVIGSTICFSSVIAASAVIRASYLFEDCT